MTNTTEQKKEKPMTITPFTWSRKEGLTTSPHLPPHIAVAAAAALDKAEDGGNEVLDDRDREWAVYGDGVEYGRTSTEAEGLIGYDDQHSFLVVECKYICFEYWGVRAPGYCVREVCYKQQISEPDEIDLADEEYAEGWSNLLRRGSVRTK